MKIAVVFYKTIIQYFRGSFDGFKSTLILGRV